MEMIELTSIESTHTVALPPRAPLYTSILPMCQSTYVNSNAGGMVPMEGMFGYPYDYKYI
jgi:hypothetical protein